MGGPNFRAVSGTLMCAVIMTVDEVRPLQLFR